MDLHTQLLIALEKLRMKRMRQTRAVAVSAVLGEITGKRKKRSVWVKPWLQRRVFLGQYDTLMAELIRESRGDFKSFLRIEPAMFYQI